MGWLDRLMHRAPSEQAAPGTEPNGELHDAHKAEVAAVEHRQDIVERRLSTLKGRQDRMATAFNHAEAERLEEKRE